MSSPPPIPARSRLREVWGLIIAVLIAGGVIYLLMALGSAPSAVKLDAQAPGTSVAPGSDGQLQNGQPSIVVAIDEELIPDLIRITTIDSNTTFDLGGRIFYVDPQTSVRVSETGSIGTRVRILSGPQKGRVGWVPSGWIKPL